MITEWYQVWVSILRFSTVMMFAFCYETGGRGRKWVRRFVGPAVLAVGCMLIHVLLWGGSVFTWTRVNWPFFGCIALYAPALCLGYGGATFGRKLARRALYGLGMGLVGLACGITSGHVGMGIFQLLLAMAASLYLGLANPVQAVTEEGTIAILSVALVPMML